jgi:hypothetical protein
MRNEGIWHALDIPPVTEILADYRMAWYEYLLGMSINCIPRRLLNYRPTGRRSIGHHRKRWID